MGSLENSIFSGGFTKNQYICRGDCLKRGLGQFSDLRGGLAGVVFLWGVVTQVQTMDFEQVNVRWVGRKRF